MFGMLRTVMVVVVTLAVLSVAAIAWPYFSPEPRPGVLEALYGAVRPTPLGEQVSNVLGAQDAAGGLTPDAIQKAVTQRVSDTLQTETLRIRNDWLISQIESALPTMAIDQQDRLLRALEVQLAAPEQAASSSAR